MNDDNSHIVQSFDDDLEKLHAMVREMGDKVADQIARCGTLMETGNMASAPAIVADDKAIDALEAEVNDHAVLVLTRRQPMADDLRLVLTAMKVSAALERAGDYAKNIAKRVSALEDYASINGIQTALVAMARLAEAQVRSSLQSYDHGDAELALAVWTDDVELDRLHNEAHGQILSAMRRSHAHDLSHMLFVAKNLERIGDYATNVAELVHFQVTGRYPEDDRPKADQTAEA